MKTSPARVDASSELKCRHPLIAQTCSLLYRRFAIGRQSNNCVAPSDSRGARRIQCCDTADYKSALRGSPRIPQCIRWGWAFLPLAGYAQITNDIPRLQPPYPELPPSFWEQYGLWLLGLGGLLATLVGLVVWRWLSPKPPVLVPIEIQTRQQLETLRKQDEDGRTLSQVSRCLRRYLTIAFQLPTEELTTSEFCRAMTGQSAIDPDLTRVLCDFLRRCDELKFAPAGNSPPFGAAEQALKLFEAGERRRAELQRIASSHAQNPPQKPS